MIAEKMTKRKRIEKEVVAIPEKQATITLKEYKNAIGLKKEGNAYLEVLSQGIVKNMHFNNGTINMQGILSTLTDQDIEKLRDTEVEKIDLTLLRAFYTIILKECEKSNFQCPECMEIMFDEPNRTLCSNGHRTIPIWVPDLKTEGRNNSKAYKCPFCNGKGTMSLIGLRSATASKSDSKCDT